MLTVGTVVELMVGKPKLRVGLVAEPTGPGALLPVVVGEELTDKNSWLPVE